MSELTFTDDNGEEWFLFAVGYEYEGNTFDAEIWATDFEDAERRLAAILSGPLSLALITDRESVPTAIH